MDDFSLTLFRTIFNSFIKENTFSTSTRSLLIALFVPSWNSNTQKTSLFQEETNYVRRSQRDYNISFKLQVVREIESGQLTTLAAYRNHGIQSRSTVIKWLRKYGNLDREKQTPSHISKTPEHRIMELEAKVKLLEKQKSLLELQAYVADKKLLFLI